MKFYYLAPTQKVDLVVCTLIYLIFIGFIRQFILYGSINSRNIIAYTLIFFAWYGCTMLFANAYTYEGQYSKLKNI